MKIVLAPNTFKGSLTTSEAATAMAEGVLRVVPDAEIVKVPVADGGDGLVQVALEALDGESRAVEVTGPCGDPVDAAFCYVPAMGLATLEMALASGLTLLDADQRTPLVTTTLGTGELIAAALELGVTRIGVGLGGSATNDGGIGMASALGARFLDQNGETVEPVGGSLGSIRHIDLSGLDPRIQNVAIDAVCDVDNPLCGPTGAAPVYGPQKGAGPEEVEMLDAGLANLADVIERDLGLDIRDLPGAGAAGGLGAGLKAFLGAELRRGVDLVLDLVGLDAKLTGADLAITGEGQIDFQTVFGKAPAGVGAAAKTRHVPCIAMAGSIGEDLGNLHEYGIDAIFALANRPMTLEESMKKTHDLLANVTENAMRFFVAARRGQL